MGQPQQSDWDWNWWMEEFPGDLRIVEGERLSEMWERWKRREGEWIYLESIEKREQGYALVQCRGLQEESVGGIYPERHLPLSTRSNDDSRFIPFELAIVVGPFEPFGTLVRCRNVVESIGDWDEMGEERERKGSFGVKLREN